MLKLFAGTLAARSGSLVASSSRAAPHEGPAFCASLAKLTHASGPLWPESNHSQGWNSNFIQISNFTTSAPLERSCSFKFRMYWSAKSQRHTRKRHPFFWLTKPAWPTPLRAQGISQDNQEYIKEFTQVHKETGQLYALGDNESPLKGVTNEEMASARDPPEYKPYESIRTGLIARKIGIYPMWDQNGKRHQTTLLQVVDNHVIKFYDHERYDQICRPIYKSKFAGRNRAAIVIGAESADPQQFSSEYLGLFKEAAILPKRKLTKFHISDDAALEPGTPLYATHFRPGMFVNVWGRSRDYGFSGVRARWHMKGGPKTHGTTKAHNRIGSIGRGRKFCGPIRGKKMPGHKGRDRCIIKHLKVWRINTKYNILYVMGQNVPGINGSYCYVMDAFRNKYDYKGETPFPTHFPERDENPLPEEMYDETYHKFEDPTIVYIETEAERKAIAALAKRGRAKTAQKKR